jgi:hypothetical protein
VLTATTYVTRRDEVKSESRASVRSTFNVALGIESQGFCMLE